ncbi:hypothetical protein NFA_20650 [Nocardia farcinica IFM 10152]|uniref:Uncharacterized protein n=1 Tax=Nocardia farcinica (strain IFM 10152) TaxID=247156 RepID=Q5YY30_NOCFA|nr:hypothetical protein NFA_20650 [Nocardia farcinica IFM 10152]
MVEEPASHPNTSLLPSLTDKNNEVDYALPPPLATPPVEATTLTRGSAFVNQP